MYRYDAPLCFANAEDIRRRALGAAPEAFGLAGQIGAELLFPTLPTAVQAYQDRTKDPSADGQGP